MSKTVYLPSVSPLDSKNLLGRQDQNAQAISTGHSWKLLGRKMKIFGETNVGYEYLDEGFSKEYDT